MTYSVVHMNYLIGIELAYFGESKANQLIASARVKGGARFYSGYFATHIIES